jgi:hypothetical protein
MQSIQDLLNQMAGSGVGSQFDELVKTSIAQALSGTPSYDASSGAVEKLFKQGVANPALRAFDQDVAPRIREGFAAGGAMMSSRRGDAQRKALGDLQASLSGQLGQMQYNNMGLQASLAESAAQRQLQGVGLANQQALMPAQRASALTQALAPFQAQAQQQATGQYQEWLRTRPENSPYLAAAQNYVNSPQMAAYQTAPGTNWANVGMQGLGLGTSLWGTSMLAGALEGAGRRASARSGREG